MATKYIVDNVANQTISGNVTINGNLSANTISATTYYNLPSTSGLYLPYIFRDIHVKQNLLK